MKPIQSGKTVPVAPFVRQRSRGWLHWSGIWSPIRTFLILAAAAHSAGASEEVAGNTTWRDATRCGINSAYLLLKLNGVGVPYNTLLENFSPTVLKGASLVQLRDLLQANGLRCLVCKSDMDGLRDQAPNHRAYGA